MNPLIAMIAAAVAGAFATPTTRPTPMVINVPETVIVVHVEQTPQWGCKPARESLVGGTVKECGWYK